MTIAVGAHQKVTSAVTNVATTPTVTTAASGSTFLVAVIYPNSDTITSITDSKLNTYTLINQTADAGDGFKVALYYCQNGTGGTLHTATSTISSTDPQDVYFTEITGGATSGILDQSSGLLDTSTPFGSGVTTTTANQLIYNILASSGSSATVTWNGGFTGLDAQTTGITGTANATRVVSATGTYNAAATTSAGGNAVVVAASFKELAAAGSAQQNLGMLGVGW